MKTIIVRNNPGVGMVSVMEVKIARPVQRTVESVVEMAVARVNMVKTVELAKKTVHATGVRSAITMNVAHRSVRARNAEMTAVAASAGIATMTWIAQ